MRHLSKILKTKTEIFLKIKNYKQALHEQSDFLFLAE